MSEAHTVPAAGHTLRILRLLASVRGPLPAAMIAAQLDLPRSTVYHLLDTLQQYDFVMHLPELRRYGLGIAALELSSAYTRQDTLTSVGAPLIAALVGEVQHSAHLAIPHGREMLYAIEERAPRAPALVSGVNLRLPMHLTASGRAILALMPKAQVRAMFPDSDAFEFQLASTEIFTYAQLRAELDRTLMLGYASEHGSVTTGLSSVAVAVRDHRRWPVASVAVTFRENELPATGCGALAAKVAATARSLGTRIYGKR